ncbi:hypothetical protein AKO1_011358 [Acrasis kona]|uniref:SHOCT domain-containing protein n=1 Tax=Acrasis kona TaxID=1008807 RepID=A0AAW2YY45_9EUKA
MATLQFFLHNIPASEDNPFKLLVNSDTAYESNESITAMNIQHEVPAAISSPHQVYINVMINEKYIDELERYNLTKSGYCFSIGLDEEENFAFEQGFEAFGGDIAVQDNQAARVEAPAEEALVDQVQDLTVSDPVYAAPEETSQPEAVQLDIPPLNDDEKKQYEKLVNFRDKNYLTEEEFTERAQVLFNEARNRSANPEPEPEPELEQDQEEQPQAAEQTLNETQVARIQQLEEYYHQGYITEEQYVEEVQSVYANPDATYEEPQQEVQQEIQLSEDQQQQIERLQQFLNKGYLHEEEYINKVNQIYAAAQNAAQSQQEQPAAVVEATPAKLSSDQESQISKLTTFLQKGYITQQDFESKVSRIYNEAGLVVTPEALIVATPPPTITPTASTRTSSIPQPYVPPTSTPGRVQAVTTPNRVTQPVQPVVTPTQVQPAVSQVTLTQEQQAQIAKLQSFVAKGIISQAEFEQKKAQIESKASPATTPKSVQPINTPTKVHPVHTPTQVVQSAPSLTQEQLAQIAKLQSFVAKGIITQAEFEQKKAQIEKSSGVTPTASARSGSNTSSPQVSRNVSPAVTPQRVQPINTPPTQQRTTVTLTADQQSQIARLQSFVAKGIISQSEFEQKKAMIESKSTTTPSPQVNRVSAPSTPTSPLSPSPSTTTDLSNVKLNQEQQTQLDRLASLRSRSIITEAEFQKKKVEILSKASSDAQPQKGTNLTAEQISQINKLQQFVNKGIISQSEFEQKKAQIESKSSTSGQPTTASASSTILLTVFLNNIPASPQSPLNILLNRSNVMYTRDDDIPSSKSVVVKGNIPMPPVGDLIVLLTIQIPALGIESDQEFNLTRHGAFVLIGVDPLDNKSLTIKQQLDDNFPEPVATVSQINQNVPTGSSDIFITFAGIPATTSQPFEIYINQNQAHKSTQDMGPNHKGVIKGQVPKSKRTNDMSSPDHEIALLVKVPALGLEPVQHNLNLTQHGSYVTLSVVDGQIEVTQSDVDQSGGSGNGAVAADVAPKKQLSADELVYLQKLADLKNAGILTEDEFNRKKNDILNA